MKRISILLSALICTLTPLMSAEVNECDTLVGSVVERKTRTMFQLGRIDREVNRNKFVFKGEVLGGFSASYMSLSSDNAEVYLLLTDITASGSVTSIKPYVAYVYKDNRAIGLRFGYSTINAELESASVDLGVSNDISFDIPYISLRSHSYTYSFFHRTYTALDRKGNVALFADVEAEFSHGESTFDFMMDGVMSSTTSKTQSYDITFNPGISAFIFNDVSVSLSFQFGGLNYTRIDQYDPDGNYTGSRESSKMKFMFNVFAMKFGINYHIW